MIKPFRWYKNLASRQGRIEAGAFLIEGEKAISQIIANNPESIIEIITTEETSVLYQAYNRRIVNKKQLNSISSTRTPQGTIAVLRLPENTYSNRLKGIPGKRILVLEDIQDPGNVGSLIRTAAAFNFDGIILTPQCADPFSPKCVQSSAGTVLSLWIRINSNYLDMIGELKSRGYYLVATDLEGMADPGVLHSQNNLLLALGNEASGISDGLKNIADYRFRIPISREKAESLNVHTCGAICMFLSYKEGRAV